MLSNAPDQSASRIRQNLLIFTHIKKKYKRKKLEKNNREIMERTHRGPAMVGELPNDFLRSDSQLNRTQGEQESFSEKSRKW